MDRLPTAELRGHQRVGVTSRERGLVQVVDAAARPVHSRRVEAGVHEARCEEARPPPAEDERVAGELLREQDGRVRKVQQPRAVPVRQEGVEMLG